MSFVSENFSNSKKQMKTTDEFENIVCGIKEKQKKQSGKAEILKDWIWPQL